MDNIKIIVASDSIGETAELVARAGVSQFNPKQCKHEFLRYPYIESFENVDEVIQVAKDTNAIIVYTLIKPEIKKYMISKVNEHALKSVDIMGPLMELLSNSIEETPYYEPGMVHRLDDAYFKKIDAIEFAVKYDDGKDPKGLPKADIVLLGISRTSKTPLCMYLANRGIKAINIPLVPEVEVPKELYEIDKHKIFGLTINPLQLIEIRKRRLDKFHRIPSNIEYAGDARILEEFDFADKIIRRLGCKTIDVTQRAIEDTALIIIKTLGCDK